MKTEHLHFNEKTIAALPIPKKEDGSKIYYDDGCKNLCLIVSYGGSKTYYYLKYYQNRPMRLKIGKTTEKKLIEARAEVNKLNSMAANGTCPTNKRQILLKDISIKDFYYNHYRPKHSEPYKQPNSIHSDDYLVSLYLSKIANRKLLSLSKEELTGFFATLKQEHSVYIANRTLSLLCHMYNKAIEFGILPAGTTNPVIGIRKFPEKSRDRFMSGAEIQRFFTALSEMPNDTFKNYIILSLFLGQRRNNLLSMRWADIDFDNRTAYFEHTKNGESLTIPLTEQAYNLLKGMYDMRSSDEWVFPSASSKSGHYEEPKKAWKKLLQNAQIENLRLHDLRRTLGSYQAIAGSSLQIIGKSLGHKSIAATQVYARLTDDPIRESMQRGTDKMMEFVK